MIVLFHLHPCIEKFLGDFIKNVETGIMAF
jgi:hypothetical protein